MTKLYNKQITVEMVNDQTFFKIKTTGDDIEYRDFSYQVAHNVYNHYVISQRKEGTAVIIFDGEVITTVHTWQFNEQLSYEQAVYVFNQLIKFEQKESKPFILSETYCLQSEFYSRITA